VINHKEVDKLLMQVGDEWRRVIFGWLIGGEGRLA
jgi:hypothetical protein